jgi:hypothetical protein
VEQKKCFEKDISIKRRENQSHKRYKKRKIDLPVSADISAAAYHGDKLNGVDCHELIRLTKINFPSDSR